MSLLGCDPHLVRNLQERAARGLPAFRVEEIGGWWLRHAPGCSWWVGTVLPHGGVGAGELVRRIALAEEVYAGHGAAACFQIGPPACPDGLDALLAVRGYRRRSPVSLQVASTADVLGSALDNAMRVRLDDRPTRTWFEGWRAAHGHDGDTCAEWDMLGRVARPSAYARAVLGGETVSVGRAVADTGWAGFTEVCGYHYRTSG